MTDLPFDELTRPRADKRDGEPTTAVGRQGAEFLLAVHGHLRHELAQVVHAVAAVGAGELPAEGARGLINGLSMQRNYRALGSFCARYCQVVAIHHAIEDQRMFPEIGEGDPSLRPVLDRLGEEHIVIHDVLVALDRALLRMVDEPTVIAEVGVEVARLEAALLSHLRYEEEELLDVIRRLSIHI